MIGAIMHAIARIAVAMMHRGTFPPSFCVKLNYEVLVLKSKSKDDIRHQLETGLSAE